MFFRTENQDIPLVSKMESLELNEAGSSGMTTYSPKKMRKRLSQSYFSEKRRVFRKPMKRLNTGPNTSSVDIKQIYLCKNVTKMTQTLETIFEEPKISKTNEIQYTGLRKEKRFIVFENKKGKMKKRELQIKKTFGRKILKKKNGSMELLINKLRDIE